MATETGNLQLTWDSNPYAFGAIHLRMAGRKSALGGISSTGSIATTSAIVKGYFLRKQVYGGDDEKEAMMAVENYLRSLPPEIICGFKD